MFSSMTVNGPGYSVQLPPGFTVLMSNPFSGTHMLLPPGSSPFDVPAMVQIRPVNAFELQMLLQNLYGFDNPNVAMLNAANLGIANISGILPARQANLPQGLGHIREFEGITMRGYPTRVMWLVIQGNQASVEVIVGLNLYRWQEFIGPCLQFINAIQLMGMPSSAATLQAVVDYTKPNQVEYQLVNSDNSRIPLTSLPTTVGGTIIINVDNSIKTGNINGTGVAVGSHSLSDVRQGLTGDQHS